MQSTTSAKSKNEYLYRVFRKPKTELSGWWFVADVVAASKSKALEQIKRNENYMYKVKELEAWESQNSK